MASLHHATRNRAGSARPSSPFRVSVISFPGVGGWGGGGRGGGGGDRRV